MFLRATRYPRVCVCYWCSSPCLHNCRDGTTRDWQAINLLSNVHNRLTALRQSKPRCRKHRTQYAFARVYAARVITSHNSQFNPFKNSRANCVHIGTSYGHYPICVYIICSSIYIDEYTTRTQWHSAHHLMHSVCAQNISNIFFHDLRAFSEPRMARYTNALVEVVHRVHI